MERRLGDAAFIAYILACLFLATASTYVGYVAIGVVSTMLMLPAAVRELAHPRRSLFALWLMITPVLALISCFYTETPGLSLTTTRNLLFQYGCAVIAFLYLTGSPSPARYVWYVWACATAFVITYLLLSEGLGASRRVQFQMDVALQDSQHSDNLAINQNTISLYSGIAYSLGLGLWLSAKTARKRAIVGVSVAAALCAIVLTGSRGGVVFCTVVTLAFVGLNLTSGRAWAAVAGVAALLAASLAFEGPRDLLDRFVVSRFQGGDGASTSDYARLQYFRLSMELIEEKPFWGHGVSSFQDLKGGGQFTDSDYLELATGLGLFGAAIHYLVYAFCGVRCFSLYRRHGDAVAFACLCPVVGLLVINVTLITHLYPVIAVLVAVILGYAERSRADRQPAAAVAPY